LKGSVGFGGRNQRADVQLVQTMLNAVPAARGGAAPALGVDGICGSMTNSAIKRFQALNQCYADAKGRGRATPGGWHRIQHRLDQLHIGPLVPAAKTDRAFQNG
jgi:peptidoglycan hydrolase-like protein with peptidoglycan-binding domain